MATSSRSTDDDVYALAWKGQNAACLALLTGQSTDSATDSAASNQRSSDADAMLAAAAVRLDTHPYSNGYTLLHIAAYTGNVELLSMMLRAMQACGSSSSSVDVCNTAGCSPLHLACQQEHAAAVTALLAAGADATLRTHEHGFTPADLCDDEATLACFSAAGRFTGPPRAPPPKLSVILDPASAHMFAQLGDAVLVGVASGDAGLTLSASAPLSRDSDTAAASTALPLREVELALLCAAPSGAASRVLARDKRSIVASSPPAPVENVSLDVHTSLNDILGADAAVCVSAKRRDVNALGIGEWSDPATPPLHVVALYDVARLLPALSITADSQVTCTLAWADATLLPIALVWARPGAAAADSDALKTAMPVADAVRAARAASWRGVCLLWPAGCSSDTLDALTRTITNAGVTLPRVAYTPAFNTSGMDVSANITLEAQRAALGGEASNASICVSVIVAAGTAAVASGISRAVPLPSAAPDVATSATSKADAGAVPTVLAAARPSRPLSSARALRVPLSAPLAPAHQVWAAAMGDTAGLAHVPMPLSETQISAATTMRSTRAVSPLQAQPPPGRPRTSPMRPSGDDSGQGNMGKRTEDAPRVKGTKHTSPTPSTAALDASGEVPLPPRRRKRKEAAAPSGAPPATEHAAAEPRKPLPAISRR